MKFLDVFLMLLEWKYCLNVFITPLKLLNILIRQTVGILFRKHNLGRGKKYSSNSEPALHKAKYSIVQIAGLCDECTSFANFEGLLLSERVFCIQINKFSCFDS